MLLPLVAFLYLYLLLVVIVLVLGFFNIYHVVRFSFWDLPALIATFLFVAAMTLVLYVSLAHLSQVDWSQTIDLSRWISLTNPFDGSASQEFINQ